jgi:hypothetical protein
MTMAKDQRTPPANEIQIGSSLGVSDPGAAAADEHERFRANLTERPDRAVDPTHKDTLRLAFGRLNSGIVRDVSLFALASPPSGRFYFLSLVPR